MENKTSNQVNIQENIFSLLQTPPNTPSEEQSEINRFSLNPVHSLYSNVQTEIPFELKRSLEYPHETLSNSEGNKLETMGPNVKRICQRTISSMKKTQFKGKSSMAEFQCRCKTCHEIVGKYNFHGPTALINAPKLLDFECRNCLSASLLTEECSLENALPLAVSEPISCFLCRRNLGCGYVLVKNEPSIDAFDQEFIAPSFLTQVCCTNCALKYKFCSQCGGGSIRTGKYRPVQLFENTRKTCSLAHVRLGDRINDFEIIEITQGMSDIRYIELVNEMKLMHQEFLIGFNAVPEMMEKPEWPLADYISLKTSAQETCQDLFSYLSRPLTNSSKRYLALAFVYEQKKTGYKSSYSGFNVPFDDSRHDSDRDMTRNRVLAGFSVVEWDFAQGVLLLNSQVLRTMNRRSTLDQDLLAVLVRKAVDDQMSLLSSNIHTPPIKHIWTMIRHEHARFLMHAARMGFVDREVYFDGQSATDPEKKAIMFLSDEQKTMFSELIVSVSRFLHVFKGRMNAQEATIWDSFSLNQYLKWKRDF